MLIAILLMAQTPLAPAPVVAPAAGPTVTIKTVGPNEVCETDSRDGIIVQGGKTADSGIIVQGGKTADSGIIAQGGKTADSGIIVQGGKTANSGIIVQGGKTANSGIIVQGGLQPSANNGGDAATDPGVGAKTGKCGKAKLRRRVRTRL
ncbi:MAG: hypothetical protein ABIP91_04930 [Sphingomicrobium sp.]